MRYREHDPRIAEIATLKVLMNWPKNTIDRAVDFLGDDGKFFQSKQNSWIYDAIVYLYKQGLHIDIATVIIVLFESGKLKQAGGAEYVNIVDDDPVDCDHNLDFYMDVMKKDYIRREIKVVCDDTGSAAERFGVEPMDVMFELENRIMAIEDTAGHGTPQSLFEIIPELFKEIEENRKETDKVYGITTGISDVDRILDYLRPDTLNILAARPGVGKSAIAVNMSLAAAKNGHPVLFVSLEMGQKSLLKRFLSIQASTPYKILSGPYTPEINDKMTKAAGVLAEIPIRIIAPKKFDMMRLRGVARNFKKQNGGAMPLIVIDYLQKCVRSNKYDIKRHEAVGEFTGECKELARELDCPILLLCQISREGKEYNSPYKAKDSLKDSGNIEEDADTIMVCVSEPSESIEKTAKDFTIDIRNIINFGVVKNREEAVGLAPLYFDKTTQSIESLNAFIARKSGYRHSDVDPYPENSYTEEDDTPF